MYHPRYVVRGKCLVKRHAEIGRTRWGWGVREAYYQFNTLPAELSWLSDIYNYLLGVTSIMAVTIRARTVTITSKAIMMPRQFLFSSVVPTSSWKYTIDTSCISPSDDNYITIINQCSYYYRGFTAI